MDPDPELFAGSGITVPDPARMGRAQKFIFYFNFRPYILTEVWQIGLKSYFQKAATFFFDIIGQMLHCAPIIHLST